jgi:hopanoid biosynthesis associated RND transporter like protein HpnN
MTKHRIAHRVFGAAASAILRWPWLVIATYALLTLGSCLLSSARLEMRTDENELISSDLPYNQRYHKFLNDFGDLEFLYAVIIVHDDPERAMRVADAVAEEVSKLKEHVENVFHRISPDAFGNSSLLLSSKEEVAGIAQAVEQNADFLRRAKRLGGLAELLRLLAEPLDPSRAKDDRVLAEHGLRILDVSLGSIALAAKGGTPAPLIDAYADALSKSQTDPRRKGYFFSENGKLAFVQIMPKKDFETLEVISRPLQEIRAALDNVRQRFPGVEMGLTGRPVLQADEMGTTNRDMTISTVLAAVLVLGLTVFFFRRLRRPILAVVALFVSVGLTFGLVTITIGYLTLLSVVFAVMMIGLGCDFGMLFLARYQEELIETGDVDGSMRTTLLSAGLGIWTGGVTTACTFFSAMFVHFKGLAELGFVAGMGLLMCLVTMLTLLPALVLVSDRHIHKRRKLMPPRPIEIPFLAHVARFPKLTLAGLAIATLAGLYGFKGLPYNANLLDLQVQDLESVRYEKLIPELSNRSTWYSGFIVDSLDAVDATVAALRPLEEKGIVGVSESVRDLVPADQDEKIAMLKRAGAVLAEPYDAPAPVAPFDAARMKEALDALLDRLDNLQSLASSTGSKESAKAVDALQGPILRVQEIQASLEKDFAQASRDLERYETRWRSEMRDLWSKAESYFRPEKITPAKLPPVLRSRFVSKDGHEFLVYAYPRKNVWLENNMEEFITALRGIDPNVTGVPITAYESAKLMREGFLQAGLYSLILVFIFLLLDYRSLKYACLTMVPVFVGLFWAFQLMPRLGLDLNLANFFALPILLGCAVDGCVHMLHRFRETGSIAETGRTTGAAVCLAALSNMFGFLAMGVARHRGLASLGFVTALGCGTIMLATLVLLPSLLALFEKSRWRAALVEKDANPPRSAAPGDARDESNAPEPLSEKALGD